MPSEGPRAEIRNLAGRTKSKKEIEKESLEARKEGMGTSLFERGKLGEIGGPSKATNMMTKMGFKPGQTPGSNERRLQAQKVQMRFQKRVARIVLT